MAENTARSSSLTRSRPAWGERESSLPFEHWNLEPDLVTVAKSLGGGYVPVGAILTRRAVYDSVYNKMDRCVVHSSTFGKNDLAMAAGLATLAVLEEEKAHRKCTGRWAIT